MGETLHTRAADKTSEGINFMESNRQRSSAVCNHYSATLSEKDRSADVVAAGCQARLFLLFVFRQNLGATVLLGSEWGIVIFRSDDDDISALEPELGSW